MKNKRQYPDDDGRVIAPMNVEGMPWYARTNLPGASGGELLSKRQARMATWAALGAALTIAGVMSAGIILFVLFCTRIWLK